MTLPASVNLLLGIVAILGALAFILAYFWAQLGKATNAQLKESNDALNGRVDILKDQLGEAEKERAVDRARIEALERENRLYKDLIGEGAIRDLAKVMEGIRGDLSRFAEQIGARIDALAGDK